MEWFKKSGVADATPQFRQVIADLKSLVFLICQKQFIFQLRAWKESGDCPQRHPQYVAGHTKNWMAIF